MRVGTVQLLRRFPLRSAAGEEPAAVELTPDGVAGDRRWALVDRAGGVLRGDRAPALAGVPARLVGADLVVDVGGRALAGPDRDRALADLVGEPVGVRDATATGRRPHREGAAVHLVSAGAAGAPDAPAGCDPGDRANLVLALETALPGAERGWVGAGLVVGDAELRLTRTPRTCLGVYAEVEVPGTVRVGDAVLLRPAEQTRQHSDQHTDQHTQRCSAVVDGQGDGAGS